MKVEFSISDVEEIVSFFWQKYQDENEKYAALQNELSSHCDEYDAEKHHELYMHYYNRAKYLARFNHWNNILNYGKDKEDSRE